MRQLGYTLQLRNQVQAVNFQAETAKVEKELRDMTANLKTLAQASQDMAKDTVDDSAAVKIITLVTAFYLPGSFVAVGLVFRLVLSMAILTKSQTLYGMNFFVFNGDTKRIEIANDFWKYVVTWIPLTLLTWTFIVFWLRWTRYTTRMQGTESFWRFERWWNVMRPRPRRSPHLGWHGKTVV